MAECDHCGVEENMPYECRHCGGTYCSEHRLPENHDCPGLAQWDDQSGVFDSGFDDTVASSSTGSGGLGDVVGLDTGPGGTLAYFRGNMTFVFLGLMWATFAMQLAASVAVSTRLATTLFVLDPDHILRVWTWVTAVFAHGGFGHIAVNSIALYFFGPLVERRVGTKKFSALFLVSGMAAGLAQAGTALALHGGGPGIVGASGAIMAIMGVLTVLNPNLRVYLWFVLPMPLWLLTIGFAGLSVVFAATNTVPGVAHFAHLSGLGIGLLYGEHVKRQGTSAPEQIRFGGGGGGLGPGGPGGPGRRRRRP